MNPCGKCEGHGPESQEFESILSRALFHVQLRNELLSGDRVTQLKKSERFYLNKLSVFYQLAMYKKPNVIF